MVVSKYVTFSEGTYRGKPETNELTLLYSARMATMAYVPSAVATSLKAGRLQDIEPEVVRQLTEAEVIVPQSEVEADTVLGRQRGAANVESLRRFVLLPTRYCNMGCSYCGQTHSKGNLGVEHRDTVSRRVLSAIESPKTQSVRISWFGAEPMMGYQVIVDLAPKFIRACGELGKDIKSDMTTNGSLLTRDRMRVLVNECGITRFNVTLDGPARIHNVHRPLKNGAESFGHITETLINALNDQEIGEFILVLRTNIDNQNSEWVDDYLGEIADMGFSNPRVSMNLAPVYSWGNDVSDVELPRSDFAAKELGWMRRMREVGLNFQALPVRTLGSLCVAVTRASEVISSTGNLFSCSEYPLVEHHEASGGLGRVDQLPLLSLRPKGPFDDWHESVAAGETPCQSCTLLPVCGGACPKQWREGRSPCPTYKFNIQERFDFVAEMNGLQLVP